MLPSPPAKNPTTGSNESSSAVRKGREALRPVGSIQQPTFGTEPTEAQKMRQQITGKARRRRTRRRVRGGEYSPELERTLRGIGVNERTGAQDSASQFQTALLGLKKTRGAKRRGTKRRSLSTRAASRGTRCY